MSLEEIIQEYRYRLAAKALPFGLPRRFILDENWTRATLAFGAPYPGLLREDGAALPELLIHRKLIILGEPGAGKSTATQAIVRHLVSSEDLTPIVASLKGYDGDLGILLRRDTPEAILNAPGITRTYVLDGVDEAPAMQHAVLREDLDRVLGTDTNARMILTARQAFHTYNRAAFPDGFIVYHLLDFDEQDVRTYARYQGVDCDTFLAAVHQANCQEEIRNPFVLDAMLRRYRNHGGLSPLRSDNVGYVVDELIRSRPLVNVFRQRRALRMLAITCETVARNELTDEEALRVLHEAIEMPPAAAEQLLAELSHSILIRTPGRISFQMRSYGEYLAAEELQDKPIERVQELAFFNNRPVHSWINAITYLAEMNERICQYFAIHYPTWLLNVSPPALSESLRSELARRILQKLNQREAYIVNERTVPLRRLAHILTPEVISGIVDQLASENPHEEANALFLLSILRHEEVVPHALQRATEHRDASFLRYSAIVALINAGSSGVVGHLIESLQRQDPYYIQIVDAIGGLCTPADFPKVLPLLETNAGLSSAFYHFRELTSKEALVSAILYLTDNPDTLNGVGLDSYLEPLIELIPKYWGEDIAFALGRLLVGLQRVHFYQGKIGNQLINYLRELDQNGTAIQTLIATLQRDGIELPCLEGAIAGLITAPTAEWIVTNAPSYAAGVGLGLPAGSIRDILCPQSPQDALAQEFTRARYAAERQRREREITATREHHQHTIRTALTIGEIINASVRLKREHWPAIPEEKHEWLAQEINRALEELDLASSISWISDNQWTHPNWLEPLLELTDHYNLKLANDSPIVLALRSWAEQPIINYYRQHGFSPAAQDVLISLLGSNEHKNVTRSILSFIRQTNYATPQTEELLTTIVCDRKRDTSLRRDALELLSAAPDITNTLLPLIGDSEPSIQDHAMRTLVKRQHHPTIRRALSTLSDEYLKSCDVPFPASSPLDWIGTITTPEVLGELRILRRHTLRLDIWNVCRLVTGAIANINKTRAVTIIRDQMSETPRAWQAHLTQEAEKLESAATVEAVQQAPFDTVIKKLKGATSMIRIKVWCEGATDQAIFRTLFREVGEDEIADTVDFVGGWPNLIAKHNPERWLDGCRQAFIIMDGDQGRSLKKRNKPLTEQAKSINRRLKNYPISLQVLQRYGIENYFPRKIYETIIGRDLPAWYFPVPFDKKVQDHLREQRQPASFYHKNLNERAAEYIRMADVEGTDLAEIVRHIKEAADKARLY